MNAPSEVGLGVVGGEDGEEENQPMVSRGKWQEVVDERVEKVSSL